MLRIPPPRSAKFLLNVQFVTLTLPSSQLNTPPPSLAVFPLSVLLTIIVVDRPQLSMPPPSTAKFAGPDPMMLMFRKTESSPLVSKMVPVIEDASIVSPSLALARAERSEPAPLSFVLLTVMVAALAIVAAAQISARHNTQT